MIKRIFLAALAAGALAAVLITAVQAFTTTPIILHAEKYERGGGSHSGHSGIERQRALVRVAVLALPPKLAPPPGRGEARSIHGHENKKKEAWAPGIGLERTLFTGLSNLLAGVGFGLLLVACFAIHGKPVDGHRGVMWGLAGFAVFVLAPALGLPPEVPGAKTAALTDRQIWWGFSAATTALGLGLMVFARHWALKALGAVLIAVPHLVGAPQPAELGGAVPPELAGHFAAASIVVNAIFWAVLGWLAGTFYQRLGRENPQSGQYQPG